MVASLFKAGVLALVIISQVEAAEYTLAAEDTYSGAGFFDMWNFITVSRRDSSHEISLTRLPRTMIQLEDLWTIRVKHQHWQSR